MNNKTIQILLTALILIYGIQISIAQDENKAKCHIKSPITPEGRFAMRKTESRVTARKKIIHFRLLYDGRLKDEIDSLISAQNEQITFTDETTQLTVDSILINLSNGLSWNLNNAPPQKPRGFELKLFSKKARAKPPVTNYIKYLEFCSNWDNPDRRCKITEKYTAYTTVKTNGKEAFQAIYDIKTNTRPMTYKCRQVIPLY